MLRKINEINYYINSLHYRSQPTLQLLTEPIEYLNTLHNDEMSERFGSLDLNWERDAFRRFLSYYKYKSLIILSFAYATSELSINSCSVYVCVCMCVCLTRLILFPVSAKDELEMAENWVRRTKWNTYKWKHSRKIK